MQVHILTDLNYYLKSKNNDYLRCKIEKTNMYKISKSL